MESDGNEFLVLNCVYCVAYTGNEGGSVRFYDQLVRRMGEINCVGMTDVALSLLEVICEQVGSDDWIIGILPCHCFKWS